MDQRVLDGKPVNGIPSILCVYRVKESDRSFNSVPRKREPARLARL